MLSTSGPMVPDMESSSVDLPLARFFSSYFVLMRFSDGMVPSIWNSAGLHGRTGESRAGAGCARRAARCAAADRQRNGRSLGLILKSNVHTRSRTPRLQVKDG